MHLALIADTFPPMRTSGAVQLRDLAAEFSRQGHRVRVIIPDPGLRSPWRLSEEKGVDVLRIRTLRTKDVGYVRRTLAELLMPFIMAVRMRPSGMSDQDWDGVIWYSPTIFFGPLIWMFKRRYRCRSYLILRDIFPEWALDAGLLRRGLVYRWFKMIERLQYSVADVIGVQSPANLGYLRSWSGQPGREVEVLPNWLTPFDQVQSGSSSLLKGLAGKTIFVYVGNMGVAQGMDSLMALVREFRDDPSAFFLFVGRGSEVNRLQSIVAASSLSNVRFENEIDPDEIPLLLAGCHVGMIVLDPRHKTHNVPGKLLAYLHAGLPVLARINDGNDLKDVVESARAGLVTTGSDPLDTMYAQARQLASDRKARLTMGENALKLGRTSYSTTAAVEKILGAFRDG